MGASGAHILVLVLGAGQVACTAAAKQVPETPVQDAPLVPPMDRHVETDRCFPRQVNAWMREGLHQDPTELGADLLATYRQGGHVMTVRVQPDALQAGPGPDAPAIRLEQIKQHVLTTHDEAQWELDGSLESWNLPGEGLASLGSYTSTFEIELGTVEDGSPLVPLRDTLHWTREQAQATGIDLLRLEDTTAVLRSHNGTLAGLWTDGIWWYELRYSWPRPTGPGMGSDPIAMIDTLLPFTALPCTQVSRVLANMAPAD